MNVLVKKLKWFIIATLAILVVGMTLFGVLGFNNTADYANGYELKVVIDQPLESAQNVLKDTVDSYLDGKGISASTQEIEQGMGLLLTFNKDVENDVLGLEKAINDAMSAKSLTVEISTFAYSKTQGYNGVSVGKALLAMGAALVVIFVYALIMNKLAGALAVSASYILSMLVFIALMGITRIPAMPFVEIGTALSAVLAVALSISTVGRLREQEKNTEGKVDYSDLATKVLVAEKKKYLLALIVAFVAGVALGALLVSYTIFAGLQILLAGISATAVAYFFTPLVWTAIKSKK